MTYNFDPDQWYENHRAILDAGRARGDIAEAEFALAVEELDRRYEEMVARLDGSFQLPKC